MKTTQSVLPFASIFCILLAACSPVTSQTSSPNNSVTVAPNQVKQASSPLPSLTPAQRDKIGQKIWQNESGGKVSGLTHWNVGEQFPSMGIGHFIWYPSNYNGKFVESFPKFIAFARSKGAQGIPNWVLQSKHCPWQSKQAFDAAQNGPQLIALRNFLANNIRLQTDFIIQDSRAALGKILAAAPASDKARIYNNYAKVASTSHGTYALIDYVNFKGDGTKTSETYNGQGWGLLQVLSNMKQSRSGQDAAQAFANSAKFVLLRRVKNSPPARGESRWTAGWNNRCDTYARPL
ncbi:hypothetical protein OAB00_03455 [Akkermansiaceae bacterium]|nr:hypothetical protein [Akkermansiaceae bacterium]